MATQNAPYYDGQARSGSNGMAIASLVLGIVGLIIFPIITSVLAIVFGGIGINRAASAGGKGKAMAIWGLVLGVVGIVGWIALLAANHGHVYFYAHS